MPLTYSDQLGENVSLLVGESQGRRQELFLRGAEINITTTTTTKKKKNLLHTHKTYICNMI
jgi:hypothetical protein